MQDYEPGGAIWVKTPKNGGEKYLSISLDDPRGEGYPKLRYAAFKNKNKKSENQPDFRIVVSKPLEEKQESLNDVSFI